MGYEFDDNGKYIGWSNLFDYSSIDNLKASEYLPIPNGVTYEKRDGGFDISNQLLKIAKPNTTKAEKIRAEAELLIDLQELNSVNVNGKPYTYVTWGLEIDNELALSVLLDLNTHSLTDLSPEIAQKCLKNKVSSSITNIIQNLRNMDLAYSPIAMDDMRAAADRAEGAKADRMTLMNPLTKFVMLEQNMVGKGVISITAVGEKVFFNLSHYYNEGVKKADPDWIRNLLFSHTFSRILGLSKGNPVTVTKTKLTNVNFENLDDIRLKFSLYNDLDKLLRALFMITDADIYQKTDNWKLYHDALMSEIRRREDSDVYADDLISQLLSAATDNAKELILARINADTKLARCYLYLIMLGFDINDIVAFMTSKTASLINELSTSNMFDDYLYNVSVNTAINILLGNFPVSKFLVGRISETTMDEYGEERTKSPSEYACELLTNLLLKLWNLGYVDDDGPKTYKSFKTLIYDYFTERLNGRITESLSSFMNLHADTAINHNLLAFSDFVDGIVDKILSSGINPTDFREDVKEFKEVYEYATETSTFGGSFLGFNLGIPTSKDDLLSKILNIEKAMHDREAAFGLTNESENLKLEDKGKGVGIIDNDDKLLELVNLIKEHNSFLSEDHIISVLKLASEARLINNFDFVKWLNNKNGYRKLTADYYNLIKGTWNIFDAIDKLPHFESVFLTLKATLTIDSTLFKKSLILDTLCEDLFGKSFIADKDTIGELLKYTDKLLVLRYFKEKQFKFPVFEGDSIFRYNWDSYEYKGKPSYITLIDEASRGTFKKLIEEVLKPLLELGFYYDIVDGVKVRKDFDSNNLFIKHLIFDIDRDGQLYLKLDLDMQDTNATTYNETRYLECLSDFIKLKLYKLGELSIADWIMVYNLMVNRNTFGSDRLTSLFVPFVDGTVTEDSVIKDFMEKTGNLDYADIDENNIREMLEDWGYDKNDAYYDLAPVVSKAQEANTKTMMIKLRTPEGTMIVKRKNRFGKYYGSEDIIPNNSEFIGTEEETKSNKMFRMLNYYDYGTLRTPFANKKSSLETNLDSEDFSLVVSALRYYSKLGILDVFTKNC